MSDNLSDQPMTNVEAIRALLARGAYIVDAGKVADAIVERLLAGRWDREAPTSR